MTTITLQQVDRMKAEDIRRYNENREYAGNAATDQRIDYILSMSDEDYMNMHNEAARKENARHDKKIESQKNFNKGIQDNLTSIAQELGITKKNLTESLKKNQKLFNDVRFKGYRNMEVIKSNLS
jgi:hypothetical protein